MYISRLELRNFMCHSSLELHFNSGVNYLVGDNNAGKTTILKALQYLHDGIVRGHDISEYRHHDPYAASDLDTEAPIVVTADLAFDLSEVPAQCRACDDSTYDANAKGHLFNDIAYDQLLPYIFFDEKTQQYLLRIRRNSATITLNKKSKGKASTLSLKDIGVFDSRDDREDEFTNATGISAKIQRLFDPIFVWADDSPDAAADFSPTKIMGKMISAETAKFKDSELWLNFIAAHKKAFITGENDADGQSESLQQTLNSVASAISTRMNAQYGGNNEVQFAFEEPDVSNFVKMGQVLIHEAGYNDFNNHTEITAEAELQHKGTGMQRAFALAAVQEYAEQLRTQSVKTSDNDSGEGTVAIPIVPSLVVLDEPDLALHPRAQYTLADSLHKSQNCQYFITTHSPYMLHGYSDCKDTLHVLCAASESQKKLLPSGNLQIVSDSSPSIPAITYFAFGIPTPEFHSELYGRITNVIEERTHEDNLSVSQVGKMIGENFENMPMKERFDSRRPRQSASDTERENWEQYGGNVSEEELPLYIRNCTDHPESIGKMKDAAKTLDEFKHLNNTFDTDELHTSIEYMLTYLEHYDTSITESGKQFMHHPLSNGRMSIMQS